VVRSSGPGNAAHSTKILMMTYLFMALTRILIRFPEQNNGTLSGRTKRKKGILFSLFVLRSLDEGGPSHSLFPGSGVKLLVANSFSIRI